MTASEGAHTPVPSIKHTGSALTASSATALRSVEAEATVGATGWCRLEFAIDKAPAEQNPGVESFEIGDAIEVSFVTADDTAVVEEVVFKGEVVAIGTEVNFDGQQLVVDAFDGAYKLGPGVRIRTFVDSTDSDILSKIAGEAGLSLDTSNASLGTSVVEHRVQYGTNQELVEQICRRNGHTWKVVDSKLYVSQGASSAAAAVTLAWGSNLRRLSARYSTADHSGEVTVRGWDPASKQEIVGTDNSINTTFPSTPTVTGGHSKVDSARKATSVRSVVSSQTEADDLAKGIARKMVATAFSGDGEATGNPKIVAGCKVTIEQLADEAWNGDYWVTTARHSWTDYQQYVTQFQFGPVEPSSLVDVFGTTRSGHGAAAGFGSGITIGLVTNNNDPENQGHIKVKYPYLGDDLESGWVRLASHGAGAERGILFLPEVDDEVVIAFEHGDVRRPYVLGSLWNGVDALPTTELLDGSTVKERVIYSRLGHKIRLSDVGNPDENFVSIELSDDATKAYFGESKVEIIANDKTLELKSGTGSILIDGASGDITLKGANIKLESTQAMTIKGGTDVKLESGTGMSVKAGTTGKVESGAMMDVKAGAILNLKGTMVKVN
jgi:phage protein D